MVLDSSVIVAIHLRETGYEPLIYKIEGSPVILVGYPTLLESMLVLTTRLGRDARPLLFRFVTQAKAECVAFDERHMEAASSAFLRFGKGRHPAALNFGDCLSYAVAAVAGMPLLFVGEDFSKTDIGRA
ncbi:MAG: type II toxin-antitoxin system VapC family toxin [Bryobacteraceae bacterium]